LKQKRWVVLLYQAQMVAIDDYTIEDCPCGLYQRYGCYNRDCPRYTNLSNCILKTFHELIPNGELASWKVCIAFTCLTPWNGYDTDNEEGNIELDLEDMNGTSLGRKLELAKFTTRLCRIDLIFSGIHEWEDFSPIQIHGICVDNWKNH